MPWIHLLYEVRKYIGRADQSGVVELQPRITESYGGSFSALPKNNSRHEPPARLVIKSAGGKPIAEVASVYG